MGIGKAKVSYLALVLPERMKRSSTVTVRVKHELPVELGSQKLQVTVKMADNKRIERKLIEVSGSSVAEVSFDLPALPETEAVIVAAFVGEDFESALQHLNSAPVPLE